MARQLRRFPNGPPIIFPGDAASENQPPAAPTEATFVSRLRPSS
ncbi:hypothetical protein [Deinococcus sp.]|nr:hypothetical protein [Deinococcus sp.]